MFLCFFDHSMWLVGSDEPSVVGAQSLNHWTAREVPQGVLNCKHTSSLVSYEHFYLFFFHLEFKLQMLLRHKLH